MAYCLLADLLEQIDERELIALTDDAGLDVVDTAAVDRAIEDAGADIDAAIGGRYPLPLATVPLLLRAIAVDLALYGLFSRRAVTGMPEIRQKRRDIAARKLEQLANGTLTLGTEATATSGGGRAVVVPETRLFSDDTMGHY